MDSDWVIPVQVAIAMTIFLTILYGAIYGLIALRDKAVWNDGHCKCGGNWKYEQAVGHEVSTTYLYVCDSCGRDMEMHKRY